MFDIPSLCSSLEQELRDAGLHIDEVLKSCNVDRSSWTGWKCRGVSPRIDTWLRAESAIRAAIEASRKSRKRKVAA